MIRTKRHDDEGGFSLIEVLVSLGLFGILTTVLFSVVQNSSQNTKSVRQTTDLNEQSRLVLNRMSRELREAKAITAAVNPMGAGFDPTVDTSVTFEVDFNGNGTIEPNASDPESLTYKYEVANRRILLQTATQSFPILADNVHEFKITYNSQRYQCDTNSDGTVTWEEVDSAPNPCPDAAGNSNGVLDQELSSISSITLEFTVLTGIRQQEYRTRLDLRNRSL